MNKDFVTFTSRVDTKTGKWIGYLCAPEMSSQKLVIFAINVCFLKTIVRTHHSSQFQG